MVQSHPHTARRSLQRCALADVGTPQGLQTYELSSIDRSNRRCTVLRPGERLSMVHISYWYLLCLRAFERNVAVDVARDWVECALLPHIVEPSHCILPWQPHRCLSCVASQQVRYKDAALWRESRTHSLEVPQQLAPGMQRRAAELCCSPCLLQVG